MPSSDEILTGKVVPLTESDLVPPLVPIVNCPVPPIHAIGVIDSSVRTIGSNTSNTFPPWVKFSTKILPQPEESVTRPLYWPILNPVNISNPAVPGTSFQTLCGVVDNEDRFIVKP